MSARDVHDWIDRWVRLGLLEDEVADRLRDDATRAGDDPEVDDTVDRVLAAARSGVVETLGYVGAALTIGTLVVLFDVANWSAPLLGVTLLLAAVVSGVGAFLLTPSGSAPAGRLAGVLGAVATAMTAASAYQFLVPDRVGSTPVAGEPLLVAVPALAVAVTMYLRHPHLLTHGAMGIATGLTCVGIGDLAGGSGADAYRTQQVVSGVLLLVVAITWIWASETGRLQPAWLGTLAAGGVAYGGAAMATSSSILFGPDNEGSVLVAVALAIGLTVVGVVASRQRVTIVGTAGLVVTVPMTFTEVFGWSGTATAATLLPVGIVVTGWAVVAGRRDART